MSVRIITEPRVDVISMQRFFVPEDFGTWESSEDGVLRGEAETVDNGGDIFDLKHGPTDQDAIPEFAGRLCYLSFGEGEVDGHKTIKGRPDNSDYLANILKVKHGSVLEHSVVGLLLQGVSRSLTHELVRHRAGFAFSQLSQRYVDESGVAFVLPPEVPEDRKSILHILFRNQCESALFTYQTMLEELMRQLEHEQGSKTEKLKRGRQTARAVLPNATETKIVVTGNMRAWRHFLEQRGNKAADVEIRRLAVEVYRSLEPLAPHILQDFSVSRHTDGTEILEISNIKV